jgi:hypothetical protein
LAVGIVAAGVMEEAAAEVEEMEVAEGDAK